MPTLAPPQPPPTMVGHDYSWMPSASHGNGVEAEHLQRLAAEVAEHGRQRAEVLFGASEADEEFSYNHVFAEPEFTVKVQYRFVGRTPPRRFNLED